ncbi:hypothetical protein [Streptomyces jumonjinensis]|uniref:hypothetical protein n=1 Tax=Streptomyces jumonjinensis TaxID=1945 RepID=UPI0037B3982D
MQRLPVVCARALAFTGRLLDGDDPLRCDERSLAALRDGLAGHTRALAREMKTRGERPLPAGPFGPVERVERLIDDSRSQTGLGALIALVMAAEQLRELALPARPRAGCSTGAPSSAAPGSVR